MITVTAQHILDLHARMADSPSGDLDWGRRAYDALAYNPVTHEIDIINTGRNDRTGESLFRAEDGQACYGVEGDADAMVVLIDTEGLANQLDSDYFGDDEKLLPEVAEDLARWLTAEYTVLLATADAKAATEAMTEATAERGRAVVRLVEVCGENQSRAARLLGVDQSTVNKIVRRVRAAR